MRDDVDFFICLVLAILVIWGALKFADHFFGGLL